MRGQASTRFSSEAEVDDAGFAQQLRILDAQAALPAVQRLRSWGLEALQVQPGESAVDVGAGTGEQVLALAQRVGPGGRSTGVEPSARMRQEAERRAAAAGHAVEMRDGEAGRLPLADASVDVLWCERVLQHVQEPQAAAGEFARVLRPGGRAVVLDGDWGTMFLHPGPPDVVRRFAEANLAHNPNPLSGRRLPGLLTAAGLHVDPDIGSSALVVTGSTLRTFLTTFMDLDGPVRSGALDVAEAEALRRDLEHGIERGEAMVSVTMFAVLARRM